jgi:hypothetical protein
VHQIVLDVKMPDMNGLERYYQLPIRRLKCLIYSENEIRIYTYFKLKQLDDLFLNTVSMVKSIYIFILMRQATQTEE